MRNYNSLQFLYECSLILEMAAFNNVGPAEKKTAAKLEKLRKENPEEVENLLKTVQVPTTGPPNRLFLIG